MALRLKSILIAIKVSTAVQNGYSQVQALCNRNGIRRILHVCDLNPPLTYWNSYIAKQFFFSFFPHETSTYLSAQGDGASYLMFARGNSIMQMPFEPTPDNQGTQTIMVPGNKF